MNLSKAVVLGGILLLPQTLRIWLIQLVVVGFAFLWSLEPAEQVPGGLFSGGTLGYAMGDASWLWLALFVFVVCRLPAAGRRARAQVAEHFGPRPTPPQVSLPPIKVAPSAMGAPLPPPPAPAPPPAPTPPPPQSQLIVVSHGKRVRRGGHTSSGVPVRDRRTVNPDTL